MEKDNTPFVMLMRNIIFPTQALAEMKSVNLFGVQQICRNSIALEQVSDL